MQQLLCQRSITVCNNVLVGLQGIQGCLQNLLWLPQILPLSLCHATAAARDCLSMLCRPNIARNRKDFCGIYALHVMGSLQHQPPDLPITLGLIKHHFKCTVEQWWRAKCKVSLWFYHMALEPMSLNCLQKPVSSQSCNAAPLNISFDFLQKRICCMMRWFVE